MNKKKKNSTMNINTGWKSERDDRRIEIAKLGFELRSGDLNSRSNSRNSINGGFEFLRFQDLKFVLFTWPVSCSCLVVMLFPNWLRCFGASSWFGIEFVISKFVLGPIWEVAGNMWVSFGELDELGGLGL